MREASAVMTSKHRRGSRWRTLISCISHDDNLRFFRTRRRARFVASAGTPQCHFSFGCRVAGLARARPRTSRSPGIARNGGDRDPHAHARRRAGVGHGGHRSRADRTPGQPHAARTAGACRRCPDVRQRRRRQDQQRIHPRHRSPPHDPADRRRALRLRHGRHALVGQHPARDDRTHRSGQGAGLGALRQRRRGRRGADLHAQGQAGRGLVQPARVEHHRQRRLQADHRRLHRRLGAVRPIRSTRSARSTRASPRPTARCSSATSTPTATRSRRVRSTHRWATRSTRTGSIDSGLLYSERHEPLRRRPRTATRAASCAPRPPISARAARSPRAGPRSCAIRRAATTRGPSSAAPSTCRACSRPRRTSTCGRTTSRRRIGTVVAGLERREQKVDSDTAYTVTQRDIDSAFVGLNGSAGAHSWQVDARHDRNSQFGDSNTWFAGYGYRITPNWRFNVSHGTSFVAPSFNQLYFPNFGNPDLKPEEGKNTDVGITWSQDGQSVKLVRYDNRIRGFITNTTLPAEHPACTHRRLDAGLRRPVRRLGPAREPGLAGPAQRGQRQATASPRQEHRLARHRLRRRPLEVRRFGAARGPPL